MTVAAVPAPAGVVVEYTVNDGPRLTAPLNPVPSWAPGAPKSKAAGRLAIVSTAGPDEIKFYRAGEESPFFTAPRPCACRCECR